MTDKKCCESTVWVVQCCHPSTSYISVCLYNIIVTNLTRDVVLDVTDDQGDVVLDVTDDGEPERVSILGHHPVQGTCVSLHSHHEAGDWWGLEPEQTLRGYLILLSYQLPAKYK